MKNDNILEKNTDQETNLLKIQERKSSAFQDNTLQPMKEESKEINKSPILVIERDESNLKQSRKEETKEIDNNEPLKESKELNEQSIVDN